MKAETLLNDLTPLIKHIAKGFYGVPLEDLMQAGAMGVQKAYLNYQKKVWKMCIAIMNKH